MPIRVSENVPKHGIQTLSEYMSAIVKDPDLTEYFELTHPLNLNVTALPHLAYFVDLEDVAKGQLLSKAKAAYWRYLIVNGTIKISGHIQVDGKIIEAGLSLTSDANDKNELLGICHSPNTDKTVKAIAYAQTLPDVIQNTFELTLLQIPILAVAAIWLQGTNNNILIPLSDAHGLLTPMKVYTEQEMIKQLQEAAAQRNDPNEITPPGKEPVGGMA